MNILFIVFAFIDYIPVLIMCLSIIFALIHNWTLNNLFSKIFLCVSLIIVFICGFIIATNKVASVFNIIKFSLPKYVHFLLSIGVMIFGITTYKSTKKQENFFYFFTISPLLLQIPYEKLSSIFNFVGIFLLFISYIKIAFTNKDKLLTITSIGFIATSILMPICMFIFNLNTFNIGHIFVELISIIMQSLILFSTIRIYKKHCKIKKYQ